MICRDLNVGCAGALLALAELVAQFGDPVHRAALEEGAHWLAVAQPAPRPLPGLYVGEAGVGASLLRAGQVLASPALLAEAAERSRLIAGLPYASPDLFNGTAGRLLFHLLVWDETADPEHLDHAVQAGEVLLAAAEPTEGDGARWSIPSGYDSMSDQVYLGYAHGAAGIGDVLLELHAASGDRRFLEAAQAAGRWLAGQAIPVFSDGSGLDWPRTEGGELPGGAWCHGAAGVGRFFLHLAAQSAMPEATELAARAARTAAHTPRRFGPTQCHGLAGSIELMLDMLQATGDRAYLAEAHTLAGLLDAWSLERDGLLVWPSDLPETVTPDYTVGYAGVAVCLLRLAEPERRPRQISRRGFRLTSLCQAGSGSPRASRPARRVAR